MISVKADLPTPIRAQVDDLVVISRKWRKEREFSFYGDEDFIPTEQYGRDDAVQAITWAEKTDGAASAMIA